MNFQQRIELIERMDKLIRLEATGSPRDFAEKLEISESTLYEFLNMMRKLGASVSYDKTRETYFHELPVKFEFGFMAVE